jgi:hypothetical protein
MINQCNRAAPSVMCMALYRCSGSLRVRSSGGNLRNGTIRLQPDLQPVIRGADIPERHRMAVLVTALSNATHQRADPRTLFDAVDGTTTSPLRCSWQDHFTGIKIGIRLAVDVEPIIVRLSAKRVGSHSSFPSCCRYLYWMIGTIDA